MESQQSTFTRGSHHVTSCLYLQLSKVSDYKRHITLLFFNKLVTAAAVPVFIILCCPLSKQKTAQDESYDAKLHIFPEKQANYPNLFIHFSIY